MADSDTNPSADRRATRTANADQHPGLVLKTRKRHTKAEIARDKALEEEQKAKKMSQKNKGIQRVAELEDQMAIDDANAESAHPRKKKGSFVFFRLTELLI
jgi:hypothetical protein